jgi:hypothetical protein
MFGFHESREILDQLNNYELLKKDFTMQFDSVSVSQLVIVFVPWESRDSSVGIALGYGLDDRSSRVRFSAGAGNFSFHHRVQNGSGVHPASYPMGTRGSFPGDIAAGA